MDGKSVVSSIIIDSAFSEDVVADDEKKSILQLYKAVDVRRCVMKKKLLLFPTSNPLFI